MTEAAGEQVEVLVAKRWPRISKAVSDALATKPALSTLVAVETWLGEPPVPRLAPAWTNHRLAPITRSADLPESTSQLRMSGPWGGALEVLLTKAVTAEQLEDTPDEAAQTAGRLALLAGDYERRSVVAIICAAAAQEPGTPKPHAVVAQADALLGGRLITRRPALAKAARRAGAFESVTDDAGMLPPHVDTLVVATYSGPLVRRLTDGLILSWRRIDEDSIRLRVSGRFFIDSAERSVVFVP